MDVDVGFIDEQSTSIHCLGHLCLHVPKLMFPYFEDIWKLLDDDLADYFHENVRYHAVIAMAQMAIGMNTHLNNNDEERFDWVKGLPVQKDLDPKTKIFLWENVLPKLI